MCKNETLEFHNHVKWMYKVLLKVSNTCIWDATWQNQQNKCAPSEDPDQPRHPPSLIRVFAVRSMGSWGPKVSSCGQRRLWSDWENAQANLSLRWTHSHFIGFVMRWLIRHLSLELYSRYKYENNLILQGTTTWSIDRAKYSWAREHSNFCKPCFLRKVRMPVFI